VRDPGVKMSAPRFFKATSLVGSFQNDGEKQERPTRAQQAAPAPTRPDIKCGR
jgi:hypothetical protein